MEPNKKLAREHGAKPGQIAIKGAISRPDLTQRRDTGGQDGPERGASTAEPKTPTR